MNLIYKNLPSNLRESCVATIGVFDGVHLGHQYILKKLKSEAKKRGKPALVITFDLPPEKILSPNQKFKGLITDCQEKISLLDSLDLDKLWILEAKKDLFNFSADQFLEYINKYFILDLMVVGSDFRFGTRAEADSAALERLAIDYDFDLKVIAKKKFKGVLASSSLVKELIKKAQFKEVKEVLGRDYQLKGKVKKGKGLGRQLGFPTANLESGDYVLPSWGVYAAYTKVGSRRFLSAVNLGKDGLETHLVNFSENILGEAISITFLEKIRPELDFQSQAKLAESIQKDIQFITSKYSIPAV